jgi:RNA polymerase sigma factor (sigma-70 family)
VNRLTDPQLLRDYAEQRSEAAFTELVRRHVDLVYSAALRMVCDAHLAEDVTQGAFVALAQNARQLTEHPVLSGWLHRTTQNLAAKAVRSDVRRRAREQEATAMNELLSAEPDAVWEHIAPQLDAALGELGEADRDALLLRYFERKSASEMAQTLGISDEAAQKRVSRAVERLRDFFAKRGITVGASGLVVVITANAVQAAPVGLAATISTAVALAGATIATTTTATAIKTIAMTAFQKTLVAATVAVLAGAGIYEARQASTLRSEVQILQQHQASLTAQIQQLQSERDNAARQRTAIDSDNQRSNVDTSELLRLRGEVGLLRRQIAATKATQEGTTNQIRFRHPYLRREEWSDKGTDKPLNTILTMFWAIGQGDETKLEQVVSRAYASQELEDLTLSKQDWEKLTGVQIVMAAWFRGGRPGERMEDLASVEAIVEKAPITDGETKDVQMHRWSLIKTNDQWLITGSH